MLAVRAYRKLILSILIIFMLFMVPIESVSHGMLSTVFKSFDELFSVGCFVLIFLNGSIRKRWNTLSRINYLYATFIIWGFLCTLANGQQSIKVVILDIVCCSKYIVAFHGMFLYAMKLRNMDKLKYYLCQISKIALIMICLYCFGKLIQTGFSSGVNIFKSHSVNAAHIGTGLFAIIFYADKAKKHIKFWAILAIATMLSSFTAKGAGGSIIIFSLVFLRNWYYGKRRWMLLPIAFVVFVFIGWNSFLTFYANNNAARTVLLSNSIQIAATHHGLGLGYGMYGTSQAAVNYSPVYYLLGFNKRYRMMPDNFSYLTDSFWPAILGQFGIIGTILFASYIYRMIRRIWTNKDVDYNIFATTMIIFLYLLIMSTASTAFFNPIAVPFGAILGLAFGEIEAMKKRDYRLNGAIRIPGQNGKPDMRDSQCNSEV